MQKKQIQYLVFSFPFCYSYKKEFSKFLLQMFEPLKHSRELLAEKNC